jgi:hypothetical protein
VFESIKSLRPHFHSLREIEGNVSLDIKLPLTWKHEEIIKPYRSIKFKVQDKNEKFTLMSLISNGTQEGYDVVFACASEIINHYGQETAASLGMVVEGDDEGPIGDIEPQESDDSELEESGQK